MTALLLRALPACLATALACAPAAQGQARPIPPSSAEVELSPPWLGPAVISQGHHGEPTHGDHGIWENTYALDIPLPVGAPVFAPADGFVHWTKDDTKGMGGRQLVLQHRSPVLNGGTCYSVFLHLSEIAVPSGHVRRGQLVARSGASSGGSETGTTPHLHFHLWSGTGSYDSHTQPIQKLLVRRAGVDDDLRYYSSASGELDHARVAGRKFISENFPDIGRGGLRGLGAPIVCDMTGALSQEALGSFWVLAGQISHKTNVPIAILLIATFRPFASVEEYADRFLESTGVGREGDNHGLMLVFTRQEAAAALRVGPGLQPVLTAETAAQLLQRDFLSQAGQGRLEEGLRRFLLALADSLARAGLTRLLETSIGSRVLSEAVPLSAHPDLDQWWGSPRILDGLRQNTRGYFDYDQGPDYGHPRTLQTLPPRTRVEILDVINLGEPGSQWRVRAPGGAAGYIRPDGPPEALTAENAIYFLGGLYEWEGEPDAPVSDARTYEAFLRDYPTSPQAARVRLNVGYCYWAAADFCAKWKGQRDSAQACSDVGALRKNAEAAFRQVLERYSAAAGRVAR